MQKKVIQHCLNMAGFVGCGMLTLIAKSGVMSSWLAAFIVVAYIGSMTAMIAIRR